MSLLELSQWLHVTIVQGGDGLGGNGATAQSLIGPQLRRLQAKMFQSHNYVVVEVSRWYCMAAENTEQCRLQVQIFKLRTGFELNHDPKME